MKLEKQIQQYVADNAALDKLRADQQAAEQVLVNLEADTEIDIDEAAELAVKAKRTIESSSFKVKSITNRQAHLRTEIVAAINYAEQGFKESERDALQARKDKAQAIIASEDFQGFIVQLKGLYALADGYTWDRFVEQTLPHHVERNDSQAIAESFDWWIDNPERPPEINAAKQAVDFTDSDRGIDARRVS